jgi:aminomethyltransferase
LNREERAAKVAAVSSDLRHTPLHASHIALGARMVPFAGWEMPVQYSGVTDEHAAVRSAAGLFDVSHMGELHFEGEHAGRCLDRLVTNDIANLAVGRAVYALACNEHGTILDDLFIYRLAAAHYLVVCNASNLPKMREHFAARTSGECTFTDRSDETGMLALQGPRAAEIVQALGALQLVALKRNDVISAELAGVPLTAARTGYTGEDGFELFCKSSDAPKLWQALLEGGRNFGLKPIGLGARDTLRLEARLSLYGNEIDETTNPLEAGLGWVVKLNKPEFLGREALIRAKAQPATRKLVGFEMVERGIARQGYPILIGGARVGIVTSGAPGLSIGKNIGLGYVPPDASAIGSALEIEIRGKAVAARVCATPFYKRA